MRYGIYNVTEWEPKTEQKHPWGGYRCAAIESVGNQGKLYLQSDGRENYKAKDDELEL